jgi:hypothetical protein
VQHDEGFWLAVSPEGKVAQDGHTPGPALFRTRKEAVVVAFEADILNSPEFLRELEAIAATQGRK